MLHMADEGILVHIHHIVACVQVPSSSYQQA